MSTEGRQVEAGMLLARRLVLRGAVAAAGALALPGGTSIAWANGDVGAPRSTPPGLKGRRPWVYWYWLDANVTKEGIVADLDAMREAGIEGVFLFNIGGKNPSTLVPVPVEAQSTLWWDLVRFAVARAGDLGLTMAMDICDGWGTAGGAWIKPEQSAQELVWSEMMLAPGAGSHALPQPTTRLGLYRDIAAFAFPVPGDWEATHEGQAKVSASWPIEGVERVADPRQAEIVVDTEQAGWLQYSFARPFTLRSVTVRSPNVQILPFLSIGYNGAANSLVIEASDDGRDFRAVFAMVPPKLGWQSNLTELTHAIPPVTARHFRLVYDPAKIETAAGDGQFPVARRLSIASLSLSSRPVVDQLQVKSGQYWGIGRAMDETLLPARDCIPSDRMVDVSDRLAADGTLAWRAPAGRWAVLRLGATTNGVLTSPSGKAGGLECDKFDPATVGLQFDGWFGEALRQVGPELAEKVLKVLHIDSWEARSQNWSPRFADEFRARRGYDIRPFLPAMAGIPIDNSGRTDRFLFDVRRTIADLLRDNFFATLERLAHEKGCLFSAQQTNATFPSDGMQHFRHVDLPAGEFWKGQPLADKPSDVREAVSAARLYGKTIASAEAFTGQLDWSEHPFSFKAQGDQNFCFGINRLVLHVWPHQAFPERRPGTTLFGIGSLFSETQPWWPMAGAWIDYISRCQALLQEGSPVVDVCYYTGEDIPSRAYLPDTLNPSLPSGYAYDSINPDALLTLAAVCRDRIMFPGGASYALMVLPDAMPLSLRMARKLRELVADGATLLGARPKSSPTLEDDDAAVSEIATIVNQLWKSATDPHSRPVGQGRVIVSADLAATLASLSIAPDVEIDGAEQILWTHRRSEARDIYFFSNQGKGPAVFSVSVRAAGGHVSLYDAVRDRWTLPVTTAKDNRTELRLALEETGSIFVIFDEARTPRRITSIETQGAAVLPEILEDGAALVAETNVPGQWTIRTTTSGSFALDVPDLPATVTIGGPWDVRFEGSGRPAVKRMAELVSWTDFDDPEIRFHSGTARYSAAFDLSKTDGVRWRIEPGRFAEIVRVMVNGKDLGVLWIPGTACDATEALRSGRNIVEILVANTWRNRLVGDRDRPPAERSTWLLPNTLGSMPPPAIAKDAQLLPAGLLGPVKVSPFVRRTLARYSARHARTSQWHT